jgi:hypothetical protein
MISIFLFAFGLSQPALADAAVEAERVRLNEEMENLSSRDQWVAVERKYQQILKLKKVELHYEDHMLGAQAAKNMGDLSLAYERVLAALAIEARPEGEQWKVEIESAYAKVRLKTEKKSAPAKLVVAQMPFIPEQQDAIRRATKLLESTGRFEGLLPYGEYSVGEEKFTVIKSESVLSMSLYVDPNSAIALAEKEESNANQPPEKTSSVAMGPWVNVGGSFLQGGDPQSPDGLSPNSFGGMSGQLGLGLQFGIKGSLRLLTEASFTGTLLRENEMSAEAAVTENNEVNTSSKRYTIWTAASIHKKNWTFYGGPSYTIGMGTIQGVPKETLNIDASPYAQETTYVEGRYGAAGLQVGTSMRLFSMGDKLDGGLGLFTGLQKDPERLYSWGQLSLTVSPTFSEKG